MSMTATETRLTGKHILIILLSAFAVIGCRSALSTLPASSPAQRRTSGDFMSA